MYTQIPLLFGAALLGLTNAQRPHITAPPGPRFTAGLENIAKRQGNPIEVHKDYGSYGAPIGVDTQYLTMEGSTTKVYYPKSFTILDPVDAFAV